MLELQTNGSVIAEPQDDAPASEPRKRHAPVALQINPPASKPQKDVWDKVAAVAPIVSGFLIFATGTYCSYSFNQQQLKIQEAQTIEKFIPHLMGNEQSKKAAIMALSSLTNTEIAGKVAQIFASTGTVSALQSLSKSGSEKDKAIATQALSNALQNLADRESKLSSIEEDYKKALVAKDQQDGAVHPDTPYNLNKLAQLYIMRGQYDLAEPLLKRSLAIRERIYGPDNPEVADALKGLAELYQLSGKTTLAEASLKQARAIENKLTSPANDPPPAFEEKEKTSSGENPPKVEIDGKAGAASAHESTRTVVESNPSSK